VLDSSSSFKDFGGRNFGILLMVSAASTHLLFRADKHEGGELRSALSLRPPR